MFEKKNDSPRNGTLPQGNVSTVAANKEKVTELVTLLKGIFPGFSGGLAGSLNLFQHWKAFSVSLVETGITKDMLSVAAQLLAIPSSFISDTLGGSETQSINDRLTGLGRLEMICEMNRQNRLVLVVPDISADDYVDFTDPQDTSLLLKKHPLMRGHIMASSTATSKGDASGLPIAKILAMRRDQLFFLQLNATYLPAREQSEDYKDINDTGRKPYQGALDVLLKGAFKFSEANLYEQKILENDEFAKALAEFQSGPPDPKKSPPQMPASISFRCKSYSEYTALTLEKMIFAFIGLDSEFVKAFSAISDTLQMLDEAILPQLGSALSLRDHCEFSELTKFVTEFKMWWIGSAYLPMRNQIYGYCAELEINAFLKSPSHTPAALFGLVNKAAKNLEEMVRTIPVLITMHPEDHSEKITPMHAFSTQLLMMCRAIMPKVKLLQKSMGPMDDRDVCTDKMSFLSVYSELRTRYLSTFSIDLNEPSRGVKPNEATPPLTRAFVPETKAKASMEGNEGSPRQPPKSPTFSNRNLAMASPSNGVATKSPGRTSSIPESPRRSNPKVDSPREGAVSGGNTPGSRTPGTHSGTASPRVSETPPRQTSPTPSPKASPRPETTTPTDLTAAKPGFFDQNKHDIGLRGKPLKKNDSLRRSSLTKSATITRYYETSPQSSADGALSTDTSTSITPSLRKTPSQDEK